MRKILLLAFVFLAQNLFAESQIVTAPESVYKFDTLYIHSFPQKDFPITRYGAKAGNVKATTDAFRKAMAACNKAGGGRVVVPAGIWKTGPIHFKSNCELHLSEAAVLAFSDDPSLYPTVQSSWEGAECMNYSPLIYAFECENVAISGRGKIEPIMDNWRKWFDRPDAHIQATRQLYAMASTDVPVCHRVMNEGENHMRPQLIQFNRCSNVHLSDFKINGSPFWTIHLLLSRDVWIHGLDVYAHGHNNDGVDIEMTQHVVIEDCIFDQGDDGIVLKAGRNRDGWRLGVPTSDVVVRNCRFKDTHGMLVVGSEMSAGVRNIYMHDCFADGTLKRMYYVKTNARRGGFVENITMENCRCGYVEYAMFSVQTDVLYQWRDIVPTFVEKPTVIRNLTMKGCEAGSVECICEILGDSRQPVRDVSVSGVKVTQVRDAQTHYENAVNVFYDR